jgi:hypothetical protein
MPLIYIIERGRYEHHNCIACADAVPAAVNPEDILKRLENCLLVFGERKSVDVALS